MEVERVKVEKISTATAPISSVNLADVHLLFSNQIRQPILNFLEKNQSFFVY